MSVDASELERYLALLETADETIDRETAARLRAAAETLAGYAQGIAHRKSGQMADSIHQLGPFALGGGILESQIGSAAPYTLLELNKGEQHDWASRTLQEQAAVLDRLEDETGRIVVAAVGG